MHNLALGIVSDEIAPRFREAVDYGTSWGISLYELRVLETGRVPNVDKSDIDEVLRAKQDRSIHITALSPGIFKHPLSRQAPLREELTDVLPRTLELANRLEAPLVIVFGFQREENEPAANFSLAVETMQRAAERAAREEIVLAVENEPGFWCDSGTNTARLIRAVNTPALRANWDPCNGYGTPETPYPDGYESLKPYIANVHVKDTKKGALIECVPVGEGAIDWSGQLAALVRDRIVKHVTIETHCLPLVENSRKNVETLRQLLHKITQFQEK